MIAQPLPLNQGPLLCVKTHWRSDTRELPGAQAAEGEPLDDAVEREVLAETDITSASSG